MDRSQRFHSLPPKERLLQLLIMVYCHGRLLRWAALLSPDANRAFVAACEATSRTPSDSRPKHPFWRRVEQEAPALLDWQHLDRAGIALLPLQGYMPSSYSYLTQGLLDEEYVRYWRWLGELEQLARRTSQAWLAQPQPQANWLRRWRKVSPPTEADYVSMLLAHMRQQLSQVAADELRRVVHASQVSLAAAIKRGVRYPYRQTQIEISLYPRDNQPAVDDALRYAVALLCQEWLEKQQTLLSHLGYEPPDETQQRLAASTAIIEELLNRHDRAGQTKFIRRVARNNVEVRDAILRRLRLANTRPPRTT